MDQLTGYIEKRFKGKFTRPKPTKAKAWGQIKESH